MRSILSTRRSLCTKPAFTPAQSILTSIRAMLPRAVTTGVVNHGEPILYVEPKDVPITLQFLRDHTGTRCKQLSEQSKPARVWRAFQCQLALECVFLLVFVSACSVPPDPRPRHRLGRRYGMAPLNGLRY